MTRNGLLTPVEALEILGIYNPEGKAKPNTDYLTRLNKRNLLAPIKLGTKTFRYKMSDCQRLLKMVEETGLNLTLKP
jgi:hypothetical protein